MANEFTPIETQEAFDAAIKARIERAERKVREEFGDYDDLKAQAAKWDEKEEGEKSDLQKAQEHIRELEDAAAKRDASDKLKAAREKVAKETGVPAELISGDDEESMTEFAQAVAKYAKKPVAPNADGAGRFNAGDDGGKDSDLSAFASQLFGESR